MRIYLAARYTRRLELCEYKAQLEAAGHRVTSRWLLKPERVTDAGAPADEAGETLVAEAERAADEDVTDVTMADLLLAFTEDPKGNAAGAGRGGRHVELGLALGLGRWVIIVGPRENLFCWLTDIYHAATWPEALEAVAGIQAHGLSRP